MILIQILFLIFTCNSKFSSRKFRKTKDIPLKDLILKKKVVETCEFTPPNPFRRDINVRRDRFSLGQASYLYDAFDEMLLETYMQEILENFQYFAKKTGHKIQNQLAVDEDGLAKGFKDANWDIPKNYYPKDYIFIYSQSDYELFLDLRAFTYMTNSYVSQRALYKMNCTQCLQKTNQKIKDLFAYIDCTQLGFIDSTMISFQMQNLDLKMKVTTTEVNDFVIKTMEFRTAQLDIKDFTYGVLMGMMERIMPLFKTIDLTVLNIMKQARQQAIEENLAPL